MQDDNGGTLFATTLKKVYILYNLDMNISSSSQRNSYGWVIVAACTVMLAVTYGLIYSYSVFFKPLGDYFNWDRATLSSIYSISFIVRGAVSIAIGWLADKYGPGKIMAFCGLMLGLGMALSSRVNSLWQFYITYGFIGAIGFSGTFGIGTAMVSRWFREKRGLALGIVSTGSGLGTLFVVPAVERLINASSWSHAFFVCGLAGGITMVIASLFLRNAPATNRLPAGNVNISNKTSETTLKEAVKDTRMILFMGSVLLFFFSIQIVMVHLVTFATDTGITALTAATFVSVIGAVSIAGRLATGAATDKTGIYNTLIFTRIFLVAAFAVLLFARPVWSFYVFAAIFGFPYGGEIPQIPLFIGKYWGTKSMAMLVGLNTFVITVGGALGSWGAGLIYDHTQSYTWAFTAGGAAGLASLALILILMRTSREKRYQTLPIV
jgi:MFS family permease